MYWSVIDLICLGMFLCISPIVKEQGVSLSKGEKRGILRINFAVTVVALQPRPVLMILKCCLKRFHTNARSTVFSCFPVFRSFRCEILESTKPIYNECSISTHPENNRKPQLF